MKKKIILLLSLLIVTLSSNYLCAENLNRIVQFEDYWKFTVGDDMKWANPDFNDSGWDQIRVPSGWEGQGYNEYNGYAWYRTRFKIYDVPDDVPVYLLLGSIDDADEVYLNGKLIGKSGQFPPNFETAYTYKRKYVIPRDLFIIGGVNILAVRVFDTYEGGGIISGSVGIFSDEDFALIDLTLTGQWKFHLGDNKQWGASSFDDALWTSVDVPGAWESQGYENYDGYAWYRKKFTVPSNLNGQQLYLSLGKVDDVDYVYINGKYIGSVYDLKNDSEYRMKGYEYNARRVYQIPAGVLNYKGPNTIAVKVYDKSLTGGIYEGPIGIMTYPSYKKYMNNHFKSQSIWDYIINEFIID